MRAAVAAGILLVLLSSGCQDLYEADPLHAARADSSAAGYDIGEPNAAHDADHLAARAKPSHQGEAVATRRARPIGDRESDNTPPVTAVPDSANAPASGGPLDTGSPRDRTHPGGTDTTTQPRTDVATLPTELLTPADDSVVVNTFLSYDRAARTVWVDLMAGYDGANGALNFNGGFAGAHRLVIPVGWRVEARFLNRDRDLSHSAIVVKAVDPIPMMAPPAAFPNAFTISLEDGMMEGRGDVVRFAADTEGRYVLLCAVPGHGQNGMWMRLDVTRGASAPEYLRR